MSTELLLTTTVQYSLGLLHCTVLYNTLTYVFTDWLIDCTILLHSAVTSHSSVAVVGGGGGSRGLLPVPVEQGGDLELAQETLGGGGRRRGGQGRTAHVMG